MGRRRCEYHTNELNELIQAVDFISMHTYPFHNTHYNPYFWQYSDTTDQEKQINELMQNAKTLLKINSLLSGSILIL